MVLNKIFINNEYIFIFITNTIEKRQKSIGKMMNEVNNEKISLVTVQILSLFNQFIYNYQQ